ncbi:MAG: hypothetical protein RLZZ107_1488 [Bacteroidota bacterium]
MNYDENHFTDHELESWSDIKYQAKPITFEPKSALYKKRPVAAYIGIAASLLLLLTIGVISYNAAKQNTSVETNFASKKMDTNLKKQSGKNLITVDPIGNTNTTRLQNIEKSKFLEQKLNQQSENKHITTFKTSINNTTQQATKNIDEKKNLYSSSNLAVANVDQLTSSPSASVQSTFQLSTQEQTITGLKPYKVLHYCAPLVETFQVSQAQNNDINLDLDLNLLTKLDRLVSKDIGLSNNQSYDLLLPGKSNLDAQITSVGTLSQTRFQTTSNLRSHTQTEQMQMQQQLSLDAYVRALRSGFGLQTTYKQFANGAVSDYEIAFIAAPKVLLSRNIILEPSARLKLGARYADQEKLQALSFIELGPADLRNIAIDSSTEIGRRIFYKDLDFALGIQTPLFFLNAQLENAFQHFDYAFGNQAQSSQNKALQNWTISMGTQYASRNEKMRLSPYFIYTKMAQQANAYAGLQFNFKSLQLGASYGSAQQYQAAAGFVGKNCAVHIQSARQQLLSLSAPSYFHQVSLRFYSQPSRKARRYISL